MESIGSIELTPEQMEGIISRVSFFLEGIDPTWRLLLSGNSWKIERKGYAIGTFPLIPTHDDLRKMAIEGASVVPEGMADLWSVYLMVLCDTIIPMAFLEQEIEIGDFSAIVLPECKAERDKLSYVFWA